MRWLPIILAALAAAAAVAYPPVADAVKDNPTISMVVAMVYSILTALSKSPLQK